MSNCSPSLQNSNSSNKTVCVPTRAAILDELRVRRWARDPVAYFRERLHIELWEKQIEIAESVRDHRKTHVKAGHKVGKTLVAGGLVLWFMECFPNSKVVTTSASWTDVKTKLWGSIRSFYRRGQSWLGTPINETALRLTDDHYAIGLSTEQVEPFAGHNAPHVLVIYDEASGIDQRFFDAGEAQATRILETGNPLIAAGPFYKHARESEHHKISISCYDHPNVRERRIVIAGGPTFEWCEDRRIKWGEDSPLFLTRVKGEFAEESADTLFPLSQIEAAFARFKRCEHLPTDLDMPRCFGLDFAREGGDATDGYLRDRVHLDDELISRCRHILSLPKTKHNETVKRVESLHQTHRFTAIHGDAGGEGSGPCDDLIADGLPLTRIHFGALPLTDEYQDVRAEMYWTLSRLLPTLAIEPDEELSEELVVTGAMRDLAIRRIDGTKKVVFALPPKDEIKKKLGRSPDKADALALSVLADRNELPLDCVGSGSRLASSHMMM